MYGARISSLLKWTCFVQSVIFPYIMQSSWFCHKSEQMLQSQFCAYHQADDVSCWPWDRANAQLSWTSPWAINALFSMLRLISTQPLNSLSLYPRDTLGLYNGALTSMKCYDMYLFIYYLGFTALSRIFHLYRADRSSKVGENRRTREKPPFPHVTRVRLEP